VISGCSGSGKFSLLFELQRRGYLTGEESAGVADGRAGFPGAKKRVGLLV